MDPERMVSEAMRAQGGAGRQMTAGTRRPMPPPRPFPVGWVITIALLVGAVLGVMLALVSIFVPGALPVFGG